MNAKAAVAPIPAGYHSLTPYLIVDDATAAIAFYREAFGAEELMRLPMGEKIGHAELRIGDSILMLSDEQLETGMLRPDSAAAPRRAACCIWTTWTRLSNGPSGPAPPSSGPCRPNSGATAWAA